MPAVTTTPPPPHRVTLSRKRGWTMPANTMKVDRSTPYGNPFRLGDTVAETGEKLETIEDVLRVYRIYALDHMAPPPDWRTKLKGKNLACWCKPADPCHADILLKLLNPAAVRPSTTKPPAA